MRPVITRARQAVGVEGRCDSGQILLTEHPSYLPHKDVCLRKQTGGRQGGRDARLDSGMHALIHTLRQGCRGAFVTLSALSVRSHLSVFYRLYVHVCFCVCPCMNVCLNVQPPAQSPNSPHGDRGPQI